MSNPPRRNLSHLRRRRRHRPQLSTTACARPAAAAWASRCPCRHKTPTSTTCTCTRFPSRCPCILMAPYSSSSSFATSTSTNSNNTMPKARANRLPLVEFLFPACRCEEAEDFAALQNLRDGGTVALVHLSPRHGWSASFSTAPVFFFLYQSVLDEHPRGSQSHPQFPEQQ